MTTLGRRKVEARERVLALVILVLVLLLALSWARYEQLGDRIRDACSETSMAAKLDLSGLVPLCRDFKEHP